MLHAQGLRFRVDYPVPGLPRRSIDIAFTKARVGIFIDGCFWHGCPEHFTVPRRNAAWWIAKVETNRRRDEDTTKHLRTAGWHVIRLWEHDDLGFALDVCTKILKCRDAQRD